MTGENQPGYPLCYRLVWKIKKNKRIKHLLFCSFVQCMTDAVTIITTIHPNPTHGTAIYTRPVITKVGKQLYVTLI